MGARLILFFFFLSLVTFFLTLTNYKKYFNPKEDLSREQLQQTVKNYQEEQKALLAGPVKETEEPKEDTMDLEDPIIKRGLLVYTEKGQCIDCHGGNGAGLVEKKAPLLAGQHDWYVIDQVNQIKSGKRVNQDMLPYLAKLDEDDIKAVAKYIKYMRVDKE